MEKVKAIKLTEKQKQLLRKLLGKKVETEEEEEADSSNVETTK